MPSKLRKNTMPRHFAPRQFLAISQKVKIGGVFWTKFELFLTKIPNKEASPAVARKPRHPAENTLCSFHYLVGATTFEPKTSNDAKRHFEFMKKLGCKFGIFGHDHKDGIMSFTPNKVEKFIFGKVKIDKEIPTRLLLPSVVNGSFANGVAIFNTKTFEVETISLKSDKHLVPEWRKL